MIYRNYDEINNIKPEIKLWACAYEFPNEIPLSRVAI